MSVNRDSDIASLRPLVLKAVAVLSNIPSFVLREDLQQEAWIGAIKAVDSYDASKGASLFTYAKYRIRGHLLDYLRKLDPIGRETRKKLKASGVSGPINISLDTTVGLPMPATLSSDIKHLEAAEDVKRCLDIAQLPTRQYTLLYRYYWDGKKDRELAEEFGVNHTRISQLRTEALASLRYAAGAA
jgi:RNA polymerase sigma factor for flagellar operon FliA